jgi:Trk K+ transport system NAD-binding subunit
MSIMVGRQLRLILAVMCGLLFVASAVLTAVRHVNWWQALYLAVLAMFGGAQPDLGVPAIEQALEAALTVLSVALVPLVTAAVVDAVVNARLTWAGTGPVEARHGHVVVVGLGNVGTRVLEALHDFGVDVVAIDQREQARGVRVARDLGIPVVVGDATQEGTLRAAWVDTCQALIVVSTDDVSNLETALLGRSITADLRVVVRLFDGDFATRVERAFGLTLSRSVSSLAAPVFAAAMMGRAVVDAIPIRRRVLLVAELPVRAGSQVEGQPASIIHCPHEYRLLAIHTGRGDQLLWSPPRGRRLTRTDRVIVVATREGLGRLLAQCAEGPVTGRSRPVVALDVVTQAIPRPRDDDRALGTGEPAG